MVSTTLQRPAATQTDMAAQSTLADRRATAPSSRNNEPDSKTANAVRASQLRAIRRLHDDVGYARSLMVAFELAAQNDSYEKPALYWPDLMKVLQRIVPEDEELRSETDALYEACTAGNSAPGAFSAVVEGALEEGAQRTRLAASAPAKSRRRVAIAASTRK